VSSSGWLKAIHRSTGCQSSTGCCHGDSTGIHGDYRNECYRNIIGNIIRNYGGSMGIVIVCCSAIYFMLIGSGAIGRIMGMVD
jgi:hypothetical protein